MRDDDYQVIRFKLIIHQETSELEKVRFLLFRGAKEFVLDFAGQDDIDSKSSNLLKTYYDYNMRV